MKSILCTTLFLIAASGIVAQTAQHPVNLSFGGGPQRYYGDLGSGFRFKSCCWYGGMGGSANFYLNRSFDAGVFCFVGDYNFVQPDEVAKTPVAEELQCGGCFDRIGLGNLKSRLSSGGAYLRYKIGNNSMFGNGSRWKPYVYFGAAFNHIADRMKMNCVNPGNYFSLNGGAGIKFQLNERFNIGYNFALGYFTNDSVDNISNGTGDMYMQNTLVVGVDLF